MDTHDPMSHSEQAAHIAGIVGAIRRMCGATNRAGEPCGNRALSGTTVCRMHGGMAPQVQAKAAERLAAARDLALELLFTRMGEEGDQLDPKVLLEAVVKLGAQVELLEGRATSRSDTVAAERAAEVRAMLDSRLDELSAKRAERAG